MARPRKTPTTAIPASLILTSHEQKHYRRYQRTNLALPSRHQGFLPTAKEYTDFQCWLKQRDSGYFSDTPLSSLASCLQGSSNESEGLVASLCKHTLHPSHSGGEQSCCPICTVEMYMRYVRLLKEHVQKGDGMVWQRWEPSPERDPIVDAWRAGKLSLLRTIEKLEEYATEEMDWANRYPGASFENAKTAERALQIYHAAMEEDSVSSSPQSSESESSPVASTTSSSSSSTSSRSSIDTKPRRNVSFDSNTIFTLGRSPHYFWRKSPRYEAGKYAVPTTCDSETTTTAFIFGAPKTTIELSFDDLSALDKGGLADEDKDEENLSSITAPVYETEGRDDTDDDQKKTFKESGDLACTNAFGPVEEAVELAVPEGIKSDDADDEWEAVENSDSEFDSDNDDEVEEGDYVVFEEETSFIVFAD